ncbi:MAG: molybdate ABC transporter substrate-binding protein, partial [Pseudomonadota bacterium]
MRAVIVVFFALIPFQALNAEPLRVAVAANFRHVIEELAPLFREGGGPALAVSAGSTGSLAAQILQGAPFDLFLAADEETPARLIAEGRAVAGSQTVYAIGRLAIVFANPPGGELPDALLAARRVAIANPATAPYGRAAGEAIAALGLTEALEDKLVRLRNVSAAMAAVESGAVEAAFVAHAAVIARPGHAFSLVDQTSHQPLRQTAVTLSASGDPAAAAAFLAFLTSAEAR